MGKEFNFDIWNNYVESAVTLEQELKSTIKRHDSYLNGIKAFGSLRTKDMDDHLEERRRLKDSLKSDYLETVGGLLSYVREKKPELTVDIERQDYEPFGNKVFIGPIEEGEYNSGFKLLRLASMDFNEPEKLIGEFNFMRSLVFQEYNKRVHFSKLADPKSEDPWYRSLEANNLYARQTTKNSQPGIILEECVPDKDARFNEEFEAKKEKRKVSPNLLEKMVKIQKPLSEEKFAQAIEYFTKINDVGMVKLNIQYNHRD